jgi:hypothetical protein
MFRGILEVEWCNSDDVLKKRLPSGLRQFMLPSDFLLIQKKNGDVVLLKRKNGKRSRFINLLGNVFNEDSLNRWLLLPIPKIQTRMEVTREIFMLFPFLGNEYIQNNNIVKTLILLFIYNRICMIRKQSDGILEKIEKEWMEDAAKEMIDPDNNFISFKRTSTSLSQLLFLMFQNTVLSPFAKNNEIFQLKKITTSQFFTELVSSFLPHPISNFVLESQKFEDRLQKISSNNETFNLIKLVESKINEEIQNINNLKEKEKQEEIQKQKNFEALFQISEFQTQQEQQQEQQQTQQEQQQEQQQQEEEKKTVENINNLDQVQKELQVILPKKIDLKTLDLSCFTQQNYLFNYKK